MFNSFFKKLIAMSLCLMPLSAGAQCLGVVTAGGGVDFWKKLGEGAIAAGKQYGKEVIVRGPVSESSGDAQQRIIEKMVESGCRELVVAPSSIESAPQLERLRKDGVQIVLVDRDIDTTAYTVVKTNNYKAGEIAAAEMIRLLPEKSEVAVLRLDPKVPSTTQREKGFIDSVTKAGLVVSVDEYIGATRTDASVKAYNVLKENSSIRGVFTPNESTTIAALTMRKRLPKGDEIVQVGFDSHPSFIEAMDQGRLAAIVVQAPYEMGFKAVEQLYDKAERALAPQRIDIPAKLVTKASGL